MLRASQASQRRIADGDTGGRPTPSQATRNVLATIEREKCNGWKRRASRKCNVFWDLSQCGVPGKLVCKYHPSYAVNPHAVFFKTQCTGNDVNRPHIRCKEEGYWNRSKGEECFRCALHKNVPLNALNRRITYRREEGLSDDEDYDEEHEQASLKHTLSNKNNRVVYLFFS